LIPSLWFTDRFRALKPDGWIENLELSVVFECDGGTLSPESPLSKWRPIQLSAGEKMGKSLAIHNVSQNNIIEAGVC
jgi:hypothetical protein